MTKISLNKKTNKCNNPQEKSKVPGGRKEEKEKNKQVWISPKLSSHNFIKMIQISE